MKPKISKRKMQNLEKLKVKVLRRRSSKSIKLIVANRELENTLVFIRLGISS
jgi:hypothetical protein